jgi:hypothetical protein
LAALTAISGSRGLARSRLARLHGASRTAALRRAASALFESGIPEVGDTAGARRSHDGQWSVMTWFGNET